MVGSGASNPNCLRRRRSTWSRSTSEATTRPRRSLNSSASPGPRSTGQSSEPGTPPLERALCRGVRANGRFVQRSTEKPLFTLACTTPKTRRPLCRRVRKMTAPRCVITNDGYRHSASRLCDAVTRIAAPRDSGDLQRRRRGVVRRLVSLGLQGNFADRTRAG